MLHAVLHDEKNSDAIGMTYMVKLVAEPKNMFIEHVKLTIGGTLYRLLYIIHVYIHTDLNTF